MKTLKIRILTYLTGFILWTVTATSGFEPPNAAQRQKAIGPTNGLSAALCRAFDPANDFQPIPRPKPEDWLSRQKENGQDFQKFVADQPNRPNAQRRKIYLQPLGSFPKETAALPDQLKEFAEALFGLPVEIAPPLKLDANQFSTRINPYSKQRQFLAGELLTFLKTRVPDDAYCYLAITMEDLYPEESWNFVFGQASLSERVGVYSFARYGPAFYGLRLADDPKTTRLLSQLVLERCCKILGHETGHMFGMEHCIYFHCLMNGSNGLSETDASPLHLCPVCLRKFQWNTKADIAVRYQSLLEFFKKSGLEEEAAWTEKRLLYIRGI